MHGLIHLVLKMFAIDTYGERTWEEVLEKLGLESDEPILNMVQYDDETSLAGVSALLEVVQLPLDDVMEPFGAYFVHHVARQGWSKMMKSMGRTLGDFLENVNELHHFLERDFRNAVFPYFGVKDTDEGLLLTYSSPRFFPSLAVGVLKTWSELLFRERVEMREVSRTKKSVTWLVVSVGPVDPAPEVPVEAPPASSCSFSFHAFHEALVSLGKCLPAVPALPLCRPDATEPQPELVLAHGDVTDVLEDCKAGRRPSKAYLESPCHSLAPSPARALALSMDCDRGDAIADAIRAEFCIAPEKNLAEAISGMSSDERLSVARKLVRSVSAERVAAAWGDMEHFTAHSRGFWQPDVRLPEFFTMSAPCFVQDEQLMSDAPFRFLSHAWTEPDGWAELLPDCRYEELKAAEICLVSKDIASQDLAESSLWTEVRLWVDKCCICQESPELLAASIDLIEEFLELCEGLVVLFTWSYLTRLWCVYEWACFLVFHDPEDLHICADTWCRDWTQERFLHAVRNFRVSACQCAEESDRKVLNQKIKEYYSSEESFERFLKFTVIALLARCLSTRGPRCRLGLGCWVELAEECGFDELADAIRAADPLAWRAEALQGRADCVTFDLQNTIKDLCDQWFFEEVVPLIAKEREKAVSEQTRISMATKKLSIRSVISQKTPTLSVRHQQSRRSRRSSSMTTTNSMRSDATDPLSPDRFRLEVTGSSRSA